MQTEFHILTLSDLRVQALIALMEMDNAEKDRYGVQPVANNELPTPTERDVAANPEGFIRMPNGGFARRCNAQKRRGRGPCGAMAIRGREKCRIHGGRSTGPKTEDGKRRAVAHFVKHGWEGRAERAVNRARGRWWLGVRRLCNQLGITDNSAGLPGNPGRPRKR